MLTGNIIYSCLSYDAVNERWIAQRKDHPYFLGFTKTATILGKNEWVIYNDSKVR